MFEKLKNLWENKYITIETLQKWVEVNKLNPNAGLTKEEFKEITGEEYK